MGDTMFIFAALVLINLFMIWYTTRAIRQPSRIRLTIDRRSEQEQSSESHNWNKEGF